MLAISTSHDACLVTSAAIEPRMRPAPCTRRLPTTIMRAPKWNATSCRCRAGEMVATSTLVAAWNLLFELDVAVLLHRGAAVTATALSAAGHGPLARRFGQWIHDHDPGGVVDLFAAELGRAGLSDVSASDRPERIDDLLADLNTLATHHG